MSENNISNIDLNIQYMQLKKIREEVLKRYEEYNKIISFLASDAPIQSLCFPKSIENILLKNNFLRIYDLFDVDFTKIKGLGVQRCRYLTSRLDQFIAMM